MSVQTRIQTFDGALDLMIDETLSPEAYSQEFGKAARKIIQEQDAENDAAFGRDVQYETFVDGKASMRLERAQNRIVAEWDLLEPMLLEVRKWLKERSPVLYRNYRESIQLFADDDPVAIGPNMPSASEYYFAATVPYARKIERGLSSQAPEGVFQAVTSIAAKRFGNIARIKFGHRSLKGGAVGNWAARSALRSQASIRNRSGARRQEWLTRQPAIIIRVR